MINGDKSVCNSGVFHFYWLGDGFYGGTVRAGLVCAIFNTRYQFSREDPSSRRFRYFKIFLMIFISVTNEMMAISCEHSRQIRGSSFHNLLSALARCTHAMSKRGLKNGDIICHSLVHGRFFLVKKSETDHV